MDFLAGWQWFKVFLFLIYSDHDHEGFGLFEQVKEEFGRFDAFLFLIFGIELFFLLCTQMYLI